jgi:hypothetical protein
MGQVISASEMKEPRNPCTKEKIAGIEAKLTALKGKAEE